MDTLVCLFSQYCKNKYTAELCEVVQPDGNVVTYPELNYRNEIINVAKANSYIGIKYLYTNLKRKRKTQLVLF